MTSPDPPQPLSPEELAALGRFLASAPSGPDAVWADGFLHGLASLPKIVPASDWLRALTPPAATVTQAHAQRFYGLLQRHQRTVAAALAAGRPEPLADGSPAQAERWLEGFAQGFLRQPEAIARLQRDERAAQLVLLLGAYQTLDRVADRAPAPPPEALGQVREHSRRQLAASAPTQNRALLQVLAGLGHHLLREDTQP